MVFFALVHIVTTLTSIEKSDLYPILHNLTLIRIAFYMLIGKLLRLFSLHV